MSTFQLIVKGDVEQALQACNERGITSLHGNEPEHFVRWNQTQLFVVATFGQMHDWFDKSVPVDHKYHTGDLLWYQII